MRSIITLVTFPIERPSGGFGCPLAQVGVRYDRTLADIVKASLLTPRQNVVCFDSIGQLERAVTRGWVSKSNDVVALDIPGEGPDTFVAVINGDVNEPSYVLEVFNGSFRPIHLPKAGRNNVVLLQHLHILENSLIQGDLGNCTFVSLLAMIMFSSSFYGVNFVQGIVGTACGDKCPIGEMADGTLVNFFAISTECIQCIKDAVIPISCRNDSTDDGEYNADDTFGLGGVCDPGSIYRSALNNLMGEGNVIVKSAKPLIEEPDFHLAGAFCSTTAIGGFHAVTVVRTPMVDDSGNAVFAFHNGHLIGPPLGENGIESNNIPKLLPVTREFLRDVMNIPFDALATDGEASTGDDERIGESIWVYDRNIHKLRVANAVDKDGWVACETGGVYEDEEGNDQYCYDLKTYLCEIKRLHVFYPSRTDLVYVRNAPTEPTKGGSGEGRSQGCVVKASRPPRGGVPRQLAAAVAALASILFVTYL
jgi:hypothetical protein